MSKLRIAVVGVGIYGINHVEAFKWNPNADLIAVCDLNKDLVTKTAEKYGVKAYTDVDEMLDHEELDAVSVATPDAFHVAPVLSAIRHRKPVFVEKPLATNSDDARKIITEAEKYNVRIAVDYHKIWDPAAINFKNVLKLPETGKPIRGYMNMDDIIDVPTKWFSWADKSSPVHFLGTHCYQQIRWYMECEVTEVYAVGTKEILKSRGIDTYDSIQAFLKFENGCYWTVENSWVYPNGFAKNNDGRTQLLCENAVIRMDSQNRGLEVFDSNKLSTPNSYYFHDRNGRLSGYGVEPMNDFIDCVQNNKPFIADAYDGLQTELIAEAVHKSVETGQVIKIKRN